MTNHCCNDCKVAQELGKMPKGSTCTPCGSSSGDSPNSPAVPPKCPAGTAPKLLPGIGFECVAKPLTHSKSPGSPPVCPVGTAPKWVSSIGWVCVAKPTAPTPIDSVAAPSVAGVPKSCQKLPWLAREIDARTTAAWRAGYHDIDAVALDVLAEVYPTTRAREPINWTLIGLGTVPAAVCLAELRRRVVSRVAFVFASLEEEAAEHRYQAVKGDLA